MARIEVEGLTFSYPGVERNALTDVDLHIPADSFVLVCGKIGSGKTTLLRHLKSELHPAGKRSGRVLFDGVSLDEMPLEEQAKQIAFVRDNPNTQLVTDTVSSELAHNLKAIGCDESTTSSRIAEMAAFFMVDHLLDKSVHELSRGQRQLLNLASAMVLQPRLVVLDGPLAAIDPVAAHEFVNTLRKINYELGATVVMSEQRFEEAYKIADFVVVMDGGRVRHKGRPRDVAKSIYIENDEMKYALPATLRIYHGVHSLKNPEESPLTIREARQWLRREVEEHGARVRHLPDKHLGNLVGTPALSFEDVRFRPAGANEDLIKGLSLDVLRGNLHALVGESGSGKTTLLDIARGALEPSDGSVVALGRRLSHRRTAASLGTRISMLPEDTQEAFSEKTVRDELKKAFGREELDPEQVDLQTKSMAHSMGIIHLLDKDPLALSGGERQLVALSKALMCDPELLLLDDPTKGLDGLSKRKLARMLHELLNRGCTILMASHDIEFSAKYASVVSMMSDGRIVTTSTPQAFFSSNIFYSTTASRMSRELFSNVVTDEEVFILCTENGWYNS